MNNTLGIITADEFDHLVENGDERFWDYVDLSTGRVERGMQHTVSADISKAAFENLQQEAAEKGNTVSEMAAIALEQRAIARHVPS